jgi:hypothetical protein
MGFGEGEPDVGHLDMYLLYTCTVFRATRRVFSPFHHGYS